MEADAVTVLIADDHDLFAASLEALLGTDEEIDVVGRASNGEEAMRLASETKPDVVLMDISMPVVGGFDAARQIRDELPETSVLFLTGSNSPTDVAEARASGGVGYVTKDKIASDLLEAIRALNARAS
jgi:DNA-binding NarL/FixJ family response regulator